jgi:hypothetical protein
MELLGRLQGTETLAMKRLSEDIVHTVTTTHFAEVSEVTIEQLQFALRMVRFVTRFLPSCIRHLFVGIRLTSIECGVLEAFVIEELRRRDSNQVNRPKSHADNSDPSKPFSGIPPPLRAITRLPLELQHAV